MCVKVDAGIDRAPKPLADAVQAAALPVALLVKPRTVADAGAAATSRPSAAVAMNVLLKCFMVAFERGCQAGRT